MNETATEFGVWVLDGAAQGRVVYTFVYDSSQPVASDRIRMFMNGGLVAASGAAVLIAPNQGLMLGDATLCIGNRPIGARSLDGGIYYAAFYETALSDSELILNAQRLVANDDPF